MVIIEENIEQDVMNLDENAGSQPEGKMVEKKILTKIDLVNEEEVIPEVSQDSDENESSKMKEETRSSTSIATPKNLSSELITGSSTKDDIAIQKGSSQSPATVSKERSGATIFHKRREVENVSKSNEREEVQSGSTKSVLGSSVSSAQLRRAATSLGGSILNTSLFSNVSKVGSTIVTGVALPAGILANVIAGMSELSNALSKYHLTLVRRNEISLQH